MGGRIWATGRPAPTALAAALIALALPACGEDEEIAASVTRGPAPPAGDLVATSTSVRPEDGFATLATTTAQSRGSGDALVLGLVQLKGGEPDLRLTVNGKPVRGAETRSFGGGEGSVSAVFCACDLEVGESDVALEASSGSTVRVGARSLVAYTPVALKEVPSAEALSAASISDEAIPVTASGEPLATTTLEGDAEKLVVIAAYQSAAESSASPDVVRTEGVIDGEVMDQVGSATMPGGRIVVFFAPSGAQSGSEIELRGFVTAGEAPVKVSAIAACACDLEQ